VRCAVVAGFAGIVVSVLRCAVLPASPVLRCSSGFADAVLLYCTVLYCTVVQNFLYCTVLYCTRDLHGFVTESFTTTETFSSSVLVVHDLHEPNQKQNRQTNTNQISETFQEPHNQITESFSNTETFSNKFRERLYCTVLYCCAEFFVLYKFLNSNCTVGKNFPYFTSVCSVYVLCSEMSPDGRAEL